MRRLAGGVRAASDLVARATDAVCIGLIYVMLGLLSAQVFLRYFFGAPPSWTEELAVGLFCWLVLLYATIGLRERFHVVIDLLPEGAVRLRALSDRLVHLLMLVFGIVLAYSGWAYVLRTHGQRSAALQLPIETLHLAAPVCGALMILHAVALILSPSRPAAR